MSKDVYTVVVQRWLETESGWGQRPDGVSLHLSKADCKAYCKEYWEAEHKRTGGVTPSEYSREYGDPSVVDVNRELYAKVKASKNGVRFWEREWSAIQAQGPDWEEKPNPGSPTDAELEAMLDTPSHAEPPTVEPKEQRTSFSVFIPESVRRRMLSLAALRNQQVAELTTTALKEYLLREYPETENLKID